MSTTLVTSLTRIALSLFAAVTLWGCDEGATDRSTESEAAGCSLVGTTAWWNQSFPEQTAMFHVELEATPSVGGIDAVIGLSNGPQTAWNKLAAIVRFNPAGTLDARDGGVYRADQVWSYQPGSALRLRFDVDVRTRTYSVWWKHAAFQDTYRAIGRNYAFRTEQAALTRLTNIASFVNPDTGAHGTVNVCNTSVVRDMTTADGCTILTAGAGFSNQPVGASSQVMVVDVEAKPGAANIDAVFGVTTGPADDYNDMAAAVRFYTNGRLEVRDASTYRADTVVTYEPGQSFTLRFVIDLWSRRYSVFVSPYGTPEPGVMLARDYRFRPQATGTTLDHVTSIVASATGRFDVCGANGRDAAPAIHARSGHFDAWPLSGENILISNAASTMWIDAVGRVQRTLPRGGEVAADQFANYYLATVQPAGVLAVEALTPTFSTRWSRTYAAPTESTIHDAMMFTDGTLGVHVYADGTGTLERIAADGTYIGSTPVSGIVSLDAQGYATMSNDAGGANGVTIERHLPDGSLGWSRSYPGPYSASEIASAADGSIVFGGFNYGDVQFGPSLIYQSHSPDADNSFVVSLSPTGDVRFAERLDASWFGGLATNGTRLVVARQKHIGPIINEYVVWDVSGANGHTINGNGLSHFGRSFDVWIGSASYVYTNTEMEWPDNFTGWGFFVGIGP